MGEDFRDGKLLLQALRGFGLVGCERCDVDQGGYPVVCTGVRDQGTAVRVADEDDGAVGNRDARFVIGVKGMWDAGERDAETFRQWIRHAGNRIRPFSTGRSYINFQTADEDEHRIQATYGTNFDRLTEIKKIYDPDNMFRVNRNITPSA